MKDNLAIRKWRLFTFVPKNYVLYAEPIIGGKGRVKANGLRLSPFSLTRAIDMQDQFINFKQQKINAEGNTDVILDLAVNYRVDGGARHDDADAASVFDGYDYEQEEDLSDEPISFGKVIKTIDKPRRRLFAYTHKVGYWQTNHPIEKYLKARPNIVKEKNGLEKNEGILESIVMDAIRSNLSEAPFEVLKNLSNPDAIEKYCDKKCDEEIALLDPDSATYEADKNEIMQKYAAKKVEYTGLNEKVQKDVKDKFQELGLKLNNIILTKVDYPDKVNEAYNEQKIAKEQQKIEKIKAETEAKVAEIKATGEAKAYKAKEEAKSEIYQQRKDMFGDSDYKEVAAITSPENLPKVTEKNINIGGLGEALGAMSSYARPTREDIARSISASIEAVTAKRTPAPKPTTEEATPLFTDTPVENVKTVEEEVITENPTPLFTDEPENTTAPEEVVTEPVNNVAETVETVTEVPVNDAPETPDYTFVGNEPNYTFNGDVSITEVPEDEKTNDGDEDQPKVYKK